jgi:hypothetical protein
MADAFAEYLPSGTEHLAAPLFTALEPGLLQVSLGVIARTAPGWSLLLRRPANLPTFGGYDTMEGIVQTDVWRGPLFTNLRLTRTHSPIRLHAHIPLVQAQPIPRWLHQPAVMADMHHGGLADMTAQDWLDWHATFIEPAMRPDRPDGEYSVMTRKGRRAARTRDHTTTLTEVG